MPEKTEGSQRAGTAVYGIIDPDYARIFTQARIKAWQYGYAIAMHGSFTRDLDLIAIPWTDKAADADHLAANIAQATGLTHIGNVGQKPFGRQVWTLMLPGFAEPRWVDLSVAPKLSQRPAVADDTIRRATLEQAAKLLDKHGISACERGSVDPSTGSFECSRLNRGDCNCYEFDELAEKVRALQNSSEVQP